MKKSRYIAIILAILLLIGCGSSGSKLERPAKIPGIETMRNYGTRLTSATLLREIGNSMKGVIGGGVALGIYNIVLNSPNESPVYVVNSIEYNEEGFATNITGHVETPATYGEFISKGGLGVPVYEAAEPNEFGVIFGRKGNIAKREGVIVCQNPLESEELYSIRLNAGVYDKIMTASLLYRAYVVAQQAYLKNMIIELEGMVLNSASKEVIINGIKQFKAENAKMAEEEVMINFLLANQSYLDEIKESNKAAKKRIALSGDLIEAIGTGCAMQTISIVNAFVSLTADVALAVLSFDANKISAIITQNIPNTGKYSSMDMSDLNNIEKYSKYYQKVYEQYVDENKVLFNKVTELKKAIK